MRQPLRMPPTKDEYWAFRGGLDQVSPPISLDPGRCRDASNVEVGTNGGLSVTKGYERFNNTVRPSDAYYYVLSVSLSSALSYVTTLDGDTSHAQAFPLLMPDANTVILLGINPYNPTFSTAGQFVVGEVISQLGTPIGTATSVAVFGGAGTRALDATYRNLAADYIRNLIAAVPGSGSVLGVWKYAGDVYAFRNNAGGTAAVMYKAVSGSVLAAGWTAVDLGREVAFTSGGSTEVLEGDTIAGATSLATATVTRVVLTSGTWAGGDAAGYFYLTGQSGTFQAENLNVGASLNVATIAGNSTALTITPGGRYEFVNHNFAGAAGTEKMYGCNGVDRAFEFDGTAYVPIRTGMTVDTPDHVTVHKQHLFLSFLHSVQHSAIGNPLSWSVVLGAAELSAGDDVTNFVGAPGSTTGGALVIYARNRTKILYGNSAADWNLVDFNPEAGGLEWTGQYLGQGIVLDDRGVTTLASSQTFGNFRDADITANVRPYVTALRSSAVASCIVREKNQYRIFFSGGAALYCTFIGNKLAGAMPISLSHPVTCICSGEAGTGEEEVFFGSTNGFVYQMERGTSHDGEEIAWHAFLAYNHFGSPRMDKRFRKAVVEITGSGYSELSIASSLGYGTTELPTGDTQTVPSSLSAANWDSFVWDSFTWDGQVLSPSVADLDGTAENLSLMFSGSSDEFESITLNGVIVSFTPQRQLR